MTVSSRGRMPIRYRIGWRLIRVTARALLGWRCEPATPELPEGAFLLAANHKSYIDPPLVGASVPFAIRYLAKAELFEKPVLGRLIRSMGALPIRRGTGDRQSLELCLRILGAGEPLLVFPEGTRIRRHGLRRFRTGVAHMAILAGVPVVPVYVGGTWRWGSALRRRRPVRVRFGPPLLPDGEDEAGLTRRIMEAILAMADPVDRELEVGD